MLGVLAAALEARQIPCHPDKLSATVEGHIRNVEGKNLLTDVNIHYTVRVPAAKREEALRAPQVHEAGCPASQSVRRGIDIEYDWELTIE